MKKLISIPKEKGSHSLISQKTAATKKKKNIPIVSKSTTNYNSPLTFQSFGLCDSEVSLFREIGMIGSPRPANNPLTALAGIFNNWTRTRSNKVIEGK